MGLFLISFLYACLNWILHFLYDDIYLLYIYKVGCNQATEYMNLLNELHKYSLAVMITILAYSAWKRSYKVLLAVFIPLFTYIAGYFWVDNGYGNFAISGANLTEYIGGLLLILLLPMICIWLKKYCKSSVGYVAVTWIFLIIYIYIAMETKHSGFTGYVTAQNVFHEYLIQISVGVLLTAGILSGIDKWRKHDFIH